MGPQMQVLKLSTIRQEVSASFFDKEIPAVKTHSLILFFFKPKHVVDVQAVTFLQSSVSPDNKAGILYLSQ